MQSHEFSGEIKLHLPEELMPPFQATEPGDLLCDDGRAPVAVAELQRVVGYIIPAEFADFFEEASALRAAYTATWTNHVRLCPTYCSDFIWLKQESIVAAYRHWHFDEWERTLPGGVWPQWLVPIGQRFQIGDYVAIAAGRPDGRCPVYWIDPSVHLAVQLAACLTDYLELSRAEMGANIYNALASRAAEERAGLAAGLTSDGFDISRQVRAHAAATLKGMGKAAAVRAWFSRWHGRG